MTRKYPPTLLTDFYKISHVLQYPVGTTSVYSTWTPRESRVEGIDRIVAFGTQAVIQRYLVDYFNEHFFARPLASVVDEYVRIIRNTLGVESPTTEHLEELWNLGFLPLEVRALPEGMLAPLRVPTVTVCNTRPCFFWLTNFIETLFSVESWLASTSATLAFEYRKIFTRYALDTGGDLGAVPFQGHDFAFRGMGSVEAAAASGAAHLLSFVGTDTIPAILFLEYYYGADTDHEVVGVSIPATEHSVMCAYGNEEPDDEFNALKRIIGDLYPTGFVSVVSDSWDLWRVIREYLPALKELILARDGRVVIRPDSGNPIDIIAGTGSGDGSLADQGVVEALWDIFGGTVNDKGFKILDPHIGTIYGDSIGLENAEQILERLKSKGFASTNIVFGIGSHTYQNTSRDTFGYAFKSTAVTIGGVEKQIFKDPATDVQHMKRSLKGRVAVVERGRGLEVLDGHSSVEEVPDDILRVVFLDGKVHNLVTLAEIRSRLYDTEAI
jgi:nicotinamide phosphoribosyltransferase